MNFMPVALRRGTLDRVTQDGNTALHYGALYNQPNCLKLLLKGKASFSMGTGLGWEGLGALWWERRDCNLDPSPFVPRAVNAAGETALDVARRLKHTECEELVGGMEGWGRCSGWGEGTKAPGEGWHGGGGLLAPVRPPSSRAETPLTCPVPQLEQAQAGKLSLQIHVEYDWEPPQEFPYDSEDELEEKVPVGRWQGGHPPSPARGPDPVGGGGGQPWNRVSAPR